MTSTIRQGNSVRFLCSSVNIRGASCCFEESDWGSIVEVTPRTGQSSGTCSPPFSYGKLNTCSNQNGCKLLCDSTCSIFRSTTGFNPGAAVNPNPPQNIPPPPPQNIPPPPPQNIPPPAPTGGEVEPPASRPPPPPPSNRPPVTVTIISGGQRYDVPANRPAPPPPPTDKDGRDEVSAPPPGPTVTRPVVNPSLPTAGGSPRVTVIRAGEPRPAPPQNIPERDDRDESDDKKKNSKSRRE